MSHKTEYGTALPEDLGLINLNLTEYMYWLECPVSVAGVHHLELPDNLKQFEAILEAIAIDEPQRFHDDFVYVTAKVMPISKGCISQRPGWHCDGFGTDDLNYIWYDSLPTDFISFPDPVIVPENCKILDEIIDGYMDFPITRYPEMHLLKLDERIIHRPSNDAPKVSVRGFVKVTVSRHEHRLLGNSINHQLGLDWVYEARGKERNHPHVKAEQPK